MSESEIGVTSTQLYAWAKGDEVEEPFFAVKPAEAYPPKIPLMNLLFESWIR